MEAMKARNKILVERLATDPSYAAKVLDAQRNPVERTWSDHAVDFRPSKAEEDHAAAVFGAENEHERIDEIRVVAQALAFRSAEASDAAEVHKVILAAYCGEDAGSPGGFRTEPILDRETVGLMLEDPDCHWLLAEAPNGRGVVPDGAILGCCCYSIGSAASSRVGEDTGTPPPSQLPAQPPAGALRLLGCLPAFKGLLVGRRLLDRCLRALTFAGCDRVLCCVPEPMGAAVGWARRRGFSAVETAAFPPAMAETFSRPDVRLIVLERSVLGPGPRALGEGAPPLPSPLQTQVSHTAPPPPATPSQRASAKTATSRDVFSVD